MTSGRARSTACGDWVLRATGIAVVWLTLGPQIGHAAERYALRNSVSPRATASRWLRAADPDESLPMSITLRLRQADELAALITAQQDPHSALYHSWLTPDEFAARFAPLPEEYSAVVDWLRREGLVVRPKVNGVRIDFGGTVVSVERTFGVRMNHYSHRGRTPLANENPPLLPQEFVDSVDVVRLNTFLLADPLVRILKPSGAVNAMAPRDMYVAYDMQTLLDAGVNGLGQTIAVVARSDFNGSDVVSFEQQFGVPVRTPVKVFPSGQPGHRSPAGGVPRHPQPAAARPMRPREKSARCCSIRNGQCNGTRGDGAGRHQRRRHRCLHDGHRDEPSGSQDHQHELRSV